jgi:hypothetical protein
VAAVALATSGGGGSEPQTASDTPSAAQSDSAKKPKSKPEQPQAAAPDPAAPEPATPAAPSQDATPAPASGSASPTDAVSTFYTDAANDDYESAWALGTDNLHKQLVSYDSFAKSQGTLESIEFPQLEVIDQSGESATVQFKSVARHTDHTDHCTGTISVVQGDSGWLLDQLHVAGCS